MDETRQSCLNVPALVILIIHSASKFRDIVKKAGFKYENGRIVVPGEEDGTGAESELSKTPKKPKDTKQGTKPASKKRKLAVTDDSDDRKVKKEMV